MIAAEALETLADYLKRLRESKGLSPGGLSKRLGISDQTIRLIERGVSQPRPETLRLYAEQFGDARPPVTYKELLQRAGYLNDEIATGDLTDEEREFLEYIRAAPKETLELLRDILPVIERMAAKLAKSEEGM